MDRDAISARSLAYHRDQQCAVQWRDFLSVLVAELGQVSGREESLEFSAIWATGWRNGCRCRSRTPCTGWSRRSTRIGAAWTGAGVCSPRSRT